jgi:hypothetical protein
MAFTLSDLSCCGIECRDGAIRQHRLLLIAPPVKRMLANSPPLPEIGVQKGSLVLHIRVVDANYQGFGGLGLLDGLTVRRVESVGLKFPAYGHRVTANRHVACPHIAETGRP